MIVLAIPCLVLPASAVSTYGPSGVYDSYEEGIFDYISYYFGSWNLTFDGIVDAVESMEDSFQRWWSEWDYFILELYSEMEDQFDRVVEKLTSVDDYLHAIRDDIDTMVAGIGDLKIFADIKSAINEVRDKVSGMNHNIHDAIVDQTAYLGGYYAALSEQISGYITTQKEAIVTAIDNLSKLLTGSAEDQDKADQFQDEVIQDETKFDEIIDDIATAPTINQDEITGSFDFVSEQISASGQYLDALSVILNTTLVWAIITFSIIFSIFGYVLFGKRG